MRKPAAYLFAILVGAVIWFFFQHFKIEGVQTVRVVPKAESSGGADEFGGGIVATETEDSDGSILDGFKLPNPFSTGKTKATGAGSADGAEPTAHGDDSYCFVSPDLFRRQYVG